MTYPAPVVPPVRPDRPATVTAAFFLQLGIVVALLVVVGLAVAEAIHFDGLIDRAARISNADPGLVSGERTGNVIGTIVIAVPSLLLAVWFAACAVPLRRGSNVARILTVVAGGLELLACIGPFSAGLLFVPMEIASPGWEEGPPYDGGGPYDDPYVEESKFYDAIYMDGTSDWFFVGGSIAAMVVFALSVAVVVLVLVPPANRFFVPRHDPPAGLWPPAAYPGHGYPTGYPYPVHPAYPAHPTYPYPAYPAHPGYPYPGYPGPVPPPVDPTPASAEPGAPLTDPAAPPPTDPASVPTDPTAAPPVEPPAPPAGDTPPPPA